MTAAAASHCLSGIELSIEENIGPARDVDEFCARAALGNPTGANECHLDELRQHHVTSSVKNRIGQYSPGNGTSPSMRWPAARTGSQRRLAMMITVVMVSAGWPALWMKGICRLCG